MRLLPALVALLLPIAALAQGGPDTWDKPTPGEFGNPVIGGPLGNNDPEDHVPTPFALPAPLPSTPLEQDQLRRQLVGKPVYGSQSGRIGEIRDLMISADQHITHVVVQVDKRLDPDRASLPVPWNWVRPQLDAPTIVVPWNPAMVAWLTAPGRSRSTAQAAAAPPAERDAWQSQAATELDQWRDRIEAQAPRLDEQGTDLRQLRLAYGAARDRWERLTQADEDAWAVEQGKLQADLEDLRQTWSEVAELER